VFRESAAFLDVKGRSGAATCYPATAFLMQQPGGLQLAYNPPGDGRRHIGEPGQFCS
jgi:hypothetical protein